MDVVCKMMPGACGGQWIIDVYELECASAWCDLLRISTEMAAFSTENST